jgi:hypothetical protein
MRRTEMQRRGCGLAADPSLKLTSLAPHLHERALPADTPVADDLTDGHTSNWEAAWIDLGGEG